MSKFVGLLIVAVATISTTRFDNLPEPMAAITQSGCFIKGNISMSSGRKLYHLPGMKDYGKTVIDKTKGEKWFCTESEAIASGWTRAPK